MTVEEILKRLDIDEIHDIHTVKKAYAKQVKLYHPEEDPIAFQELQQAYHEAIRYARAQQQQSVLVQESIPAREETAGEEAFTKSPSYKQHRQLKRWRMTLQKIMNDFPRLSQKQ